MAFDFAAAKAQSRRVVHDTLGVSAFYKDNTMSAPAPISVRWHSKIDRFGDLDNAGYAEIIEGIHRVIFSRERARELGLRNGGVITINRPEITFQATLTLEAMEPYDGPFEEIWTVTKR